MHIYTYLTTKIPSLSPMDSASVLPKNRATAVGMRFKNAGDSVVGAAALAVAVVR